MPSKTVCLTCTDYFINELGCNGVDFALKLLKKVNGTSLTQYSLVITPGSATVYNIINDKGENVCQDNDISLVVAWLTGFLEA